MTTKDLNQRLFEAMGWEYHEWDAEDGTCKVWESPNNELWPDIDLAFDDDLPNACASWEVCRKYVIPFMRGKGLLPQMINVEDDDGIDHLLFSWVLSKEVRSLADVEVINDNLPLALVEATLKVLEAK